MQFSGDRLVLQLDPTTERGFPIRSKQLKPKRVNKPERNN
jgi:hypothetical protein